MAIEDSLCLLSCFAVFHVSLAPSSFTKVATKTHQGILLLSTVAAYLRAMHTGNFSESNGPQCSDVLTTLKTNY